MTYNLANAFKLPPAPKLNMTLGWTPMDYVNLKQEFFRYTRDVQKVFESYQKAIIELQAAVDTLRSS